MNKIAVIGGGASATLLLSHMAAHPALHGAPIDVFERSGKFARGIAYSTPHLCHLLNVRVSNMSALADKPDDFTGWIARHGFEADSFAPRRLYGDYLEEKLEEARDHLNIDLITANVLPADVTDYDVVIQATGNCTPLRPPIDKHTANYIDDPWRADYGALAQLDHIAIIGSGLSAIDTILALMAHEYQGGISVISRRGLFPSVHVKTSPYPSFINDLPPTPLGAFKKVKRHVRRAAEQNVPWQAVIDSMRPHTNAVWQSWNKTQQARFMKHLFTYWNVHRHRMAPEIAEQIQALMDSGRLQVICADARDVKTNMTDAVINCLGYRYREHDFRTQYRIGPAAFGSAQFETTAIPEIRAQAAEIARKLAGN